MKNKLKIIAFTTILSAVLLFVLIKVTENTLTFPQKIDGKALNSNVQEVKDIPINKEFSITFNNKISSKQAVLVKVIDENRNEVPISLKVNNKTISVLPPKEGYEYGKKYTMEITKVKNHWYSNALKYNLSQFSVQALGDIIRPVDGKLNNSGTNVLCKKGSIVFLDLPGTVQKIDKKSGNITVNHNNGLISQYSGMTSFPNIENGEKLNKGEVLGKCSTNFKIEFVKNSVKIGMSRYLKYKGNEKYILVNKDLTIEERMATLGKSYKVVGENDNKFLIELGNTKKWIPKEDAALFDEKPNENNTLGWCYVSYEKSSKDLLANKDFYCNIKSSETGIGIISPTWFSITGDVNKPSSISVNSIANLEFTKSAHSKGYLVWGLVSNVTDNKGETSSKVLPRTKYLLSNSTIRHNVEDQIVSYGQKYDLDGINIDFEGFGDSDVSTTKNNFTIFIRELHEKLIKINIKLSVDVTVGDGSLQFSKCYDRKGIADNSDYVIVMVYDEHWQGSKEAGSVASYGWSKSNVTKTLKEVDNEKFILGIPLYGREYILDKSGEVVKDRTLTMAEMKSLENAKGASKEYNQDAKQNVIKYTGKDGNTHIFWQEDLDTLKWREQLSKDNNLSGIAGWQLTPLENSDSENLIMEAFKDYSK